MDFKSIFFVGTIISICFCQDNVDNGSTQDELCPAIKEPGELVYRMDLDFFNTLCKKDSEKRVPIKRVPLAVLFVGLQ